MDEIDEVEEKEDWSLFYCYKVILKTIETYVDIDKKYMPILGCWVIGTYFHEWFQTFPYLFFNATRGGGKSRTLRLLCFLSRNGTMDVNLTESVLFRKAAQKTAFFIDELEYISSKEKANLRLLLNAAYKRGIGVERARKDIKTENYVIDRFEVFTPIAMANIWGLDDVLQDRCITVILEKSSNPAILRMVELWNSDSLLVQVKKRLEDYKSSYNYTENEVYEMMFIAENIYTTFPVFWNILMINYNNNIISSFTSTTSETSYDDLIRCVNWLDLERISIELAGELCELGRKLWDSGIIGRNLELFMPLVLVAHEIGTGVEDAVIESAKQICEERKREDISENKDTALISFLVTLEKTTEMLAVRELSKSFKLMEEGEWINPKWVGRALRRLGIVRLKKHTTQGNVVILNWEKIDQKAYQLGIDVDALKEAPKQPADAAINEAAEKISKDIGVPDYLKQRGSK